MMQERSKYSDPTQWQGGSSRLYYCSSSLQMVIAVAQKLKLLHEKAENK